MQKDIARIAEHLGVRHQSLKAIEELEELVQAIENLREEFTVGNYENLVEEIADVEIMITQLKYFHEIYDKDLDFIKREKIQRTIERYQIDQEESE